MSLTRQDIRTDIGQVEIAYRKNVNKLTAADASATKYIEEIIRLGWSISDNEISFADRYLGDVLEDPKEIAKFREAVEFLILSIRNPEPVSIGLFGETILGTFEQYLQKLSDDMYRASGTLAGDQATENLLGRRIVRSLLVSIKEISLMRRLNVAAQHAKAFAQEAENAANSAREQAGFAAGSTLTKQFDDLATEEQRTTKIFRWLTALMVGIGVAGTLLLSPGEQTTVAQAIYRVALLAGVLGLATYFGRQAGHHRDLATWAKTIKVQLLTFDGYVTPVSDDQLRDQMRATFAGRVFGSSPENKDDSGATLTIPLLQEIATILSKVGPATPK